MPLHLEGLEYAVGSRRLLHGISLTIAADSTTVILGPNGAGKSLLLRLCHGLIQPTGGRVHWNLPEPPGGSQAMVFQRPMLLRRSTRANLAHALRVNGVMHQAARARIDDALVRFGLTELADRPARLLSGGEQQRLAIARAWTLRPQVLFLDEPTSQLDPAATRTIESLIRELAGEGMTIVMTTHDLAQARRLAGDVAFLHHGRLIETGQASEFFAHPASSEAQAFLAGDLIW